MQNPWTSTGQPNLQCYLVCPVESTGISIWIEVIHKVSIVTQTKLYFPEAGVCKLHPAWGPQPDRCFCGPQPKSRFYIFEIKRSILWQVKITWNSNFIDKDSTNHKAENIYYRALFRKSLLTRTYKDQLSPLGTERHIPGWHEKVLQPSFGPIASFG